MRTDREILTANQRIGERFDDWEKQGFCGAEGVEQCAWFCCAYCQSATDVVVAANTDAGVLWQTDCCCNVWVNSAEICT